MPLATAYVSVRERPDARVRLAALSAWSSRGWNGYLLAAGAVSLALLARVALEPHGRFYYLPLVLAVMLPALLASRGPTILAIALSILANVALVARESAVDAAINALLFAGVGVAIGEIARARRTAQGRSDELKARLGLRDATIEAMLTAAAVVTLRPDRIIHTISRPACHMFRTTEAEAQGQPFQSFVEYFDPSAMQPATGDLVAEQYWLGRRRDGEVFPLGIQIAQIPADDGSQEIILTLTDLSLWHSSELRNQALNEQLNQVWRMNSLGEMAAILAHDLNQPLTAATMYLQATKAELDKADVDTNNAGEPLGLAMAQVVRAGDIIRRARDLLAVDAHTIEAERVTSIIDDLGPILQMLGPADDVRINIDVDPERDGVMADRIQLQQALVNLVRNAVEAVADQPRRDVLICGRAISDRDYQISVEDSGPGLNEAQIGRIFQPMMTTKKNGMGLGLCVTRTIVERHGGNLKVTPSALGGAAFTFNLERQEPHP